MLVSPYKSYSFLEPNVLRSTQSGGNKFRDVGGHDVCITQSVSWVFAVNLSNVTNHELHNRRVFLLTSIFH
jgi:hypothetical protein